VILLHVVFDWRIGRVGSPRGAMVAEAAHLRLEEFRESLQWEGVEVETRVELVSGGPFADVVNRVAEEEGATLVTLGRRGQGAIATLLVGSFATDILRYGRQDLLLTHRPTKLEAQQGGELHLDAGLFSRVAVCTDFSEPEVVTLCDAILPKETPLLLLHVVETGDSLEEVREQSTAARARLEGLASSLSADRGTIRVSVGVGDSAREIIAFGREEDVSLIVVKSGGDRGLLYSILGSTTAAVAREADRPVLILRGFGTTSKPGPSPGADEGRFAGE